jgi:hypothetical protein
LSCCFQQLENVWHASANLSVWSISVWRWSNAVATSCTPQKPSTLLELVSRQQFLWRRRPFSAVSIWTALHGRLLAQHSEQREFRPGNFQGRRETVFRQQSGSRGTHPFPMRQSSTSEDNSMDRDRASPPISRGSIFGSSYKTSYVFLYCLQTPSTLTQNAQ